MSENGGGEEVERERRKILFSIFQELEKINEKLAQLITIWKQEDKAKGINRFD